MHFLKEEFAKMYILREQFKENWNVFFERALLKMYFLRKHFQKCIFSGGKFENVFLREQFWRILF